ncbi:putative pre-mRNA splicing factor [Phyllosticta citricarpa]|uniref:Pre-mRNA splicing factor n=2 Tax=Phyllosticta TaxID=121621 RepID=A0ABR1MKK7_9PEZI
MDANAKEAAILDAVRKPPEGVILPPKEVRVVLEKTAGYVVRNGAVFEERIRAKDPTSNKFSFLDPKDEYHPYYRWRVEEIKAGRGTDVSAGRVGENGAPQAPVPQGPKEPPEFHFSARMPNINAQDLDVIKLTALFAAKNGRSFSTALAQKEASNYQFDFLRPQHSLYQFFNRLVEQYKLLLDAEGEQQRKAQLQENVNNKFNMLEKAKARAEWVRYQEQQKQKKEAEEQQEKIAYAEIDWHDFVVVETVLFTEADDQTDLPPPTSLADLQSASLEQKAAMSLRPSNMRIEEAMPDEDFSQWSHTPAAYTPQPPQLPVHPPPPVPMAAGYPAAPPQEDEEERLIRQRQEERERAKQAQAAAKAAPSQMRIRNDYVPRAQAKRNTGQLTKCSICGQMIPIDEIDQHMRIEMLDPRWKEQKAKADARYSTTNLSTQDVADNLKRLASQRDDIFDPVTGARISPEEEARRKRVASGSYDGQQTPNQAQLQGMPVEEQIRQIHQKYKQ